MRAPRILVAVAALAVGAAACSSTTSPSANGSPTVVIGSTNFSEQLIVANLYADVLQHAGVKTVLKANLGAREAVEPALAHGQLDLYPEYAGTLLLFLNSNDTTQANDLSTAVPALKTELRKVGATVLQAAPAIDSNVFVVTRATASKYHLKNVSDLKPVGSQLVLGAPPECPQRPTCLLGLTTTYGIHFKSFTATDEAGPVTVSALKTGEVQVAELFSSDGNAVQNGFVELVDNKHLQPADHLIPVIRNSVDTPTVSTALNNLSAKLTTVQLSNLNIKVNVDHDDPAAVATQWLRSEGLT
ncbi:MAG TPA: ABC transporter substrate-binding protein [Acidimicrobiales bacterium]|jgi:osmoprotectant transport system substrate-binding protein